MRLGTKSAGGFSRLELVVVLCTVSLLGALLMPALATTGRADKSAVCTSNLRQIGLGMLSFAADNDDVLHTANHSQWTLNPASTNLLAPTHGLAYWGVAYLRYVGGSREVFRCPSAKLVDEWRETGIGYPTEFFLTSTYGISAYVVRPFTEPRKTSSFFNPETTVMVQDSAESQMEGFDDNLGLFPGRTRILQQWVGDGSLSTAYYSNYPFQWEWYRHDQRCNTLWLSGHVSKIPFNGLDVGIDYRYYTGETPLTSLPGE